MLQQRSGAWRWESLKRAVIHTLCTHDRSCRSPRKVDLPSTISIVRVFFFMLARWWNFCQRRVEDINREYSLGRYLTVKYDSGTFHPGIQTRKHGQIGGIGLYKYIPDKSWRRINNKTHTARGWEGKLAPSLNLTKQSTCLLKRRVAREIEQCEEKTSTLFEAAKKAV